MESGRTPGQPSGGTPQVIVLVRLTAYCHAVALPLPLYGAHAKPGVSFPPLPMRRKLGFTLIELLIVVVIIGIIVAIAIPKFKDTKGKANSSSIRSDLRNLVTAQEAYYYENSEYTDDVSQLKYTNTNGVTLISLTKTVGGWSAVATHPAAYPLQCALYVGDAPSPHAAAEREGVIGCK